MEKHGPGQPWRLVGLGKWTTQQWDFLALISNLRKRPSLSSPGPSVAAWAPGRPAGGPSQGLAGAWWGTPATRRRPAASSCLFNGRGAERRAKILAARVLTRIHRPRLKRLRSTDRPCTFLSLPHNTTKHDTTRLDTTQHEHHAKTQRCPRPLSLSALPF